MNAMTCNDLACPPGSPRELDPTPDQMPADDSSPWFNRGHCTLTRSNAISRRKGRYPLRSTTNEGQNLGQTNEHATPSSQNYPPETHALHRHGSTSARLASFYCPQNVLVTTLTTSTRYLSPYEAQVETWAQTQSNWTMDARPNIMDTEPPSFNSPSFEDALPNTTVPYQPNVDHDPTTQATAPYSRQRATSLAASSVYSQSTTLNNATVEGTPSPTDSAPDSASPSSEEAEMGLARSATILSIPRSQVRTTTIQRRDSTRDEAASSQQHPQRRPRSALYLHPSGSSRFFENMSLDGPETRRNNSIGVLDALHGDVEGAGTKENERVTLSAAIGHKAVRLRRNIRDGWKRIKAVRRRVVVVVTRKLKKMRED